MAQALWNDVKRCRQQLFASSYPIQLGKGIQPLLQFLIARKRQRIDRRLADLILEALRQVQLPRYDGALEVQPGSRRLQAAEFPAADAEFRERVVQFPLPFVAAAFGFD